MVKIKDLQLALNDAVDLVDALLDSDVAVPGYTQEEVEYFRERISNAWADLEDGETL